MNETRMGREARDGFEPETVASEPRDVLWNNMYAALADVDSDGNGSITI